MFRLFASIATTAYCVTSFDAWRPLISTYYDFPRKKPVSSMLTMSTLAGG